MKGFEVIGVVINFQSKIYLRLEFSIDKFMRFLNWIEDLDYLQFFQFIGF